MAKIGVVYPQTEFGNDPAAIRDYTQTAEALGYDHILAYDHVLGANPERPGGWSGPYTHQTPFMEPFILFSYMAAVTTKIGYATGVIILPQRQTTLVAKQAATLDVLCSGRLRTGGRSGMELCRIPGVEREFPHPRAPYRRAGGSPAAALHSTARRLCRRLAPHRICWIEPAAEFSDQSQSGSVEAPSPLCSAQPAWVMAG